MQSSPFFFTESGNLLNQSVNYGPVSGSENEQFQVTSRLNLSTESMAYAVCTGYVFMQPHESDANLVNLILIPISTESIGNGYSPAKFFVYRGLLKNRIFDSMDEFLESNDENASMLVQDIWSEFNSLVDKGATNSEKPNPRSVGWDKRNESGTEPLSQYLQATDPNFSFSTIGSGMELSMFHTTKGGFEVHIEGGLFQPDLEFVRKQYCIIEVTNFDPSHLQGHEPLEVMRTRENILSFVDPAAWYMTFNEKGVKTHSGTLIGVESIYTLLETFLTKNTVYFDIRNENQYSLNYSRDNEGESGDSDYGKHLKISWDQENYAPTNYYTDYWPLLILNPFADLSSTWNLLSIKVRTHFNPKPLIYADFAHEGDLNSTPSGSEVVYKQLSGPYKFFDNLFSFGSNNWSTEVDLVVPHNNDSQNPAVYSWLCKFVVIRQELPEPPITLPDTVIPRYGYLDNLFAPFESLESVTSNFPGVWYSTKFKRFFDHPEKPGMYEVIKGYSSTDVGFYATLVDSYVPGKLNALNPVSSIIENLTGGGATNSTSFSSSAHQDLLSPDQQVKLVMIQENGIDFPMLIKKANPSRPDIKSVPEIAVTASLLISRSNYDLLIANMNSIDTDLHHSLVQFRDESSNVDDNGVYYKSYNVNIIALNASGSRTILTSSLNVRTFEQSLIIKDNSDLDNYPFIDLAWKPLSEYLNALEQVEEIYRHQVPSFRSDSSLDQIVTRIRVHYYGFPASYKEGTLFNFAIPSAPYLLSLSSTSLCTSDAIPIATYRYYNALRNNCRIRAINESDVTEEVREIFFNTGEKNWRKTKIIKHPNGDYIDVGHALYGLCCLRHEGFYSPPHPVLQQGLNLGFSIDFTSFIGDLASVLGYSYEYHENAPTVAEIDSQYLDSMSDSDLLSDLDIFGLNEAWNKLSSDENQLSLSQLFEHYYGPDIPADNHLVPSHFSKRYTILCNYFDLIDGNGSFFADDPSSTIYLELKQRLENFTHFFYKLRTDLVNQGSLASAMFLETPNLINSSEWDSPITDQDIEYVLNKFLLHVKNNYENE